MGLKKAYEELEITDGPLEMNGGDIHNVDTVNPKVVNQKVQADHPDFNNSAQQAYEFAVSNGFSVVEFRADTNYGSLVVDNNDMTFRGDGYDAAASTLEDVEVNGSRINFQNIAFNSSSNAQALIVGEGLNIAAGQIISCGGQFNNSSVVLDGVRGWSVVSSSRLDVELTANSENCVVAGNARTTVTDNGTANAVDNNT